MKNTMLVASLKIKFLLAL